MMTSMSPEKTRDFVYGIVREEMFENYRVFSKAARVTLLQLGFDSRFVEFEFRDILDEIYYNAIGRDN